MAANVLQLFWTAGSGRLDDGAAALGLLGDAYSTASGSRMMASLLGSVGGEETACVRVRRLCFMRVVAWGRVSAVSCSGSSASMS
jgi:hypothetical protein